MMEETDQQMEASTEDQDLKATTAEALGMMRYDYYEDKKVGGCNGSGEACWQPKLMAYETADEGYIAEDKAFQAELDEIQQQWKHATRELVKRAEKATGVEGLGVHVTAVPDGEEYRFELVLATEEHEHEGRE